MLRVSSSVEYAARIMARLASGDQPAPLSAERISSDENIPRDFVDQLLMRLRHAGLVSSRRGARGGYRLAKPSREITVGDIVKAVEAGIFLPVCGRYTEGPSRCTRKAACRIRRVWARLGELIEWHLGGVPLSELNERAR